MSGKTIFIILHIVAVIFGLWALIITIPLHLIYNSMEKKNKSLSPKKD